MAAAWSRGGRSAPVCGEPWCHTSVSSPGAPEPPASLKRDYTKLPDSLPAVVARTARKVTDGATSHYEQAVKLQDYFAFSGGFQYSTQVQVGTGPNAIAKFLKDKEGFCVHFSFAMATMARTLGIPARVGITRPGSAIIRTCTPWQPSAQEKTTRFDRPPNGPRLGPADTV